jgi:hypothetical protein
MSFRRTSTSTFRRLTAAGLAALGFAGIAGSAARSAHAANLGVLVSCPFLEKAYASRNVATLSLYQRQRTGWCTVSNARRHFGAPPLLNHPSGRPRRSAMLSEQ